MSGSFFTLQNLSRPLLLTGLICFIIGSSLWLIEPTPAHSRSASAFPGYLLSIGGVLLMLFWIINTNKPRNIDVHGSARWANDKEAAEWSSDGRLPKKPGATVLLGQIVNGQKTSPFSWTTDKHVLIIASSGSGKGTDILIPNLLDYDGSVFVLDPKGENARATARHRSTFGAVHCLDPWGLSGRPSSRFNPLQRLAKPENHADVATGAATLAAALVLPDLGNNRYFTDSARQLIEALIAYVVTEENLRLVADLILVRTLLAQHARPSLEAMVKTTEGPDTIRSNAGRMLALGEREFGQILSSAITETAFLDEPRLQNVLSFDPSGQIDFDAWKSDVMSVFVCLPPQYFKAYNRWLRLMVTESLDAKMRMRQVTPSKPVLFMLDELASLERLQPVEDAIGLARGYGMQIWSIFQDLGQMKDIYRERATSFIANAGIRLFFGTQDHDTAQTVSNMLGQETWEMAITTGGKQTELRHGGRPLLTPDEVMCLPENGMICFLPAKRPLLLARTPYYRDKRFTGRWDDPRN